MFALTVTFEIAPGQMAAFRPLMEENARASQMEDGCHRFDILYSSDRPDEVLLYELYEDRAAFDAHLQTAHFLKFRDATEAMIVSKQGQGWDEVIEA